MESLCKSACGASFDFYFKIALTCGHAIEHSCNQISQVVLWHELKATIEENQINQILLTNDKTLSNKVLATHLTLRDT